MAGNTATETGAVNRHFSLHQILFFCFTALVSLPAITLVIWLERSAADASVEGAQDKHLVLARSISLAISRYLRDVESIVNHVRNDSAGGGQMVDQSGLIADANIQYIARLNDEFFVTKQLAAVDEVGFSRLPDSMRRALSSSFAAARAKPGAGVFSPVVFNQDRAPSIYIVTAETNGGYTLAEVSPAYLVELQKSIKFGSGGHAAIVDGRGHVLAHPIQAWRAAIRDISAVEPVKRMMSGNSGVVVFNSPAVGKEMIAGYVVEPRSGWGIMVPQPYQELISEARSNLTGQILIIVIATLLASIASWWLSRWLVAPIQRIADAAKGYQQSGSMVSLPEIDTPVPEEIRVLAQAYNALIESVGAEQRQLEIRVEQRTADLLDEVAERKRVEQTLRDQQVQLAHVTRLGTMGEMATGFAHELNQPLAAISAYIDGSVNRLRAGGAEPGKIIEALEKASGQAHRAGMVIRRIRDFVEDKKREFDKIDLNDAVRDAEGMLENEARLGTVTIEVDLAPESLPVYADFVQIQQVIINFGRNAIDAMQSVPVDSRKMVIQTYSTEDGSVNVTVKDVGQGLDADAIDHIFEPFFTTKNEGLGMGLAICRSIAEVHGGRTWYRSPEDSGSIFGLTLPGTQMDNPEG
jgi:signal transduction histidine kinase